MHVAEDPPMPAPAPAPPGDPGDGPPCLMPNALALPGMNHVCSNLCQDIDERLEKWSDFWKVLKAIEWVLQNDQRRRATC
eukprot:12153165-Alexandrium_andersonii.AAC.1